MAARNDEEEVMAFYESRGWPRDHKLAWCHCVERAKAEIIQDVDTGMVPADVESFAQLHDHVDANWYGWGFEDPLPLDNEPCHRFVVGVQKALHQWIARGGIAEEIERIHAEKG